MQICWKIIGEFLYGLDELENPSISISHRRTTRETFKAFLPCQKGFSGVREKKKAENNASRIPLGTQN